MSKYVALFERLEQLFPEGNAPAWYVNVAVILQANDCMEVIGPLWQYVASKYSTLDDQILKARKLREAFLKTSCLVGFPKGINACTALRNQLLLSSSEVAQVLEKDQSLRSPLPQEEKNARGKAFFSRIYDKHTKKVLKSMAIASGGDLSEFAVNSIYGDLLAEETLLDLKETSLLEFVVCYASGGSVWAQARSHMYGCRNLGNGKAEILGAVNICDAIERELNIYVKREPENWAWIMKADHW